MPIVSTMIMMRMRIVIVMIVTTTVIVIKPDRRVRLVAGCPTHRAFCDERAPCVGFASGRLGPRPGFYSRR